VLCYHAISPTWPERYCVSPEALEAHARSLLRRGYRGVTFAEAVAADPGDRVFAMTFDDAYRSVREHALPLLDRLGVRASVFAVSSYAQGGSDVEVALGDWGDTEHRGELRSMDWADLARLADEEGWEIGSHTRSHPMLTRLPDSELAAELADSRAACEAGLGRPCLSLAYPFGDFDSRVARAAAAAGYRQAATLFGGEPSDPSPLEWPRVAINRHHTPRAFRVKTALPVRRARTRARHARHRPQAGRPARAGSGMSAEPRILGATDGDPWDKATWSGSSQRIFAALQARGALVGAISTRPRWLDMAEKAAAWQRDGVAWRQRYRAASTPVSPLVKRAMTAIGSRRAAAAGADPNVLLQISGWYDAGEHLGTHLMCSYQDANVALWLTRPDLALPPDDRRIARTRAYEKRTYDRMDLIFTMSEWARRSFVEDYGQDPHKVVTVGAGANLETVPEPPAERDMSVPRLLFVGRKFDRKGGPELLDAFARLRQDHPAAELTIVGPPPRTDGDGVRWLGPIFRDTPEGAARLDELFRSATTFVMPSLYEGFGIPFLEGMAYALPCVGTDVCAIPELVLDGETGRTVPPRDPAALGAALQSLAADPATAAAMGARGRERFIEGYTWDKVAERICAALARRLEALG
jgi:starch synthase